MSEHEDTGQDLAGRLARAAEAVDGAGVTRAGIEARRQERARGRRVRQGAGAAVAAGLLVAMGVAVVASGGDDGTTVAAEGGGASTTTAAPTTFPTLPCLEPPTTVPRSTTSAPPESTTTTVTTTAPPAAPETTIGDATTLDPEGPETTIPAEVPSVSDLTEVPPCAGVEPNPATTTTTGTTLPTTTVPVTLAPDPPTTATVPAWPPALTGGTQGGEAWGVYLAVAYAEEGVDAPELVEAKAQAAAVGYNAGSGDVACDQGASEALGLDPERSYLTVAVYFATEADARLFVDLYQPGVVGLAAVETYCMD